MKSAKQILISAVIFLMSFSLSVAYADTVPGQSLGQISNNMLEPIGVFTHIMYSILYIVGGAFIAGSVIQYKAYRDNPLQTPISRPIALLILGLVLVAIPFITQLSQGASAAS